MNRLFLVMRRAGVGALAIGLSSLVSCSEEAGKGSGIMGGGGAGGGGGSGGSAPTCLNVCSSGSFSVTARIGSECIVRCGSNASATSSGTTEHRAGFEGQGELFIEATTGAADAGTVTDGGTSMIEYALVRMPENGPLAGHWLCAAGGTIDPPPSQSGMRQAFLLNQLSDLGPCAGDAASPDTLTISSGSGSAPAVTGSVAGSQITNGAADPICTGQRCEYRMPRQAGQTAGYIALHTEGPITDGSPIAISEGAWVAPQHLGFDLICSGAGSTLTRTASGGPYQVELVGLSKKSCPGTPVSGTIEGSLSGPVSTGAGS